MTAAQQQRMRDGAARARAERQAQSAIRVAAYQAWLQEGSPTAAIPEIPSDADWRRARRHQERSRP